ncbi:hypothetical protein D3C87_1822800 [compost metagenome]
MIPFSIAIDTVLPISRFSKSVSLRRSLRNFVNELGLMTLSSGVMSKKYLKDISKRERSTTSTSETLYIVFRSKYLNIRTGLSAVRPLFAQYLFNNSS